MLKEDRANTSLVFVFFFVRDSTYISNPERPEQTVLSRPLPVPVKSSLSAHITPSISVLQVASGCNTNRI